MKKQRNLILFGAGAVIDWTAPSTDCLTNIVRESGFDISDDDMKITEYIYQKLKEGGYPENDINFETIISVIEELIIYYSSFNRESKTPSIPNVFFKPKYESKLLNFSKNKRNNGCSYEIEIPKRDQSIRPSSHEEPEELFFKQLLSEIHSVINAEISSYAYHTPGNSKVMTNENEELNNVFSEWIKKMNGNNILRMYTLNYDRIFKIILEEKLNGIEIFEGFECGAAIENRAKLKPKVKRILKDYNCNVHYNLHGSMFWEIDSKGELQFPNPSFYLTAGPYLSVNDREIPTKQSERGKTLFLSNIITGYQKTQKTFSHH